MNANEFMIGDWVRCTDPKPFRIEQIDGIGELVYGDDGFFVNTADLQPIPLTVEILEKNGWRGRSRTQWQFFRDGCDKLNILLGKDYTQVEYLNMIYNPEDNAEVNYGHNFEFPRTIYVHELQHALRLCGIEKTIEL